MESLPTHYLSTVCVAAVACDDCHNHSSTTSFLCGTDDNNSGAPPFFCLLALFVIVDRDPMNDDQRKRGRERREKLVWDE